MKHPFLVLVAAVLGMVASASWPQQNDDEVVIQQTTRTLQYNSCDYAARFKRGEAYIRQQKHDDASE